MKKKLNLCNYYGMCDENGKSVGHTVKVTREYAQMLFPFYSLSLYASPSIFKETEQTYFTKTESLKYDIYVNGNSVGKRICDKFKIMENIRQILRDKGTFFFYQVDFFFFFYILFFSRKRKDRKIYCLIFHQDFTGGKLDKILKWIYEKALEKIEGVIYTQKGKKVIHKNSIWMPDFLYEDHIYRKYLEMEKQERCVCVGTMNRFKQLEELVQAFSNSSIKLLIVGRFDDLNRYEKLLAYKTDNVEIYNENIDYDSYLEILGTSRYSVIPYDMSQYINRTSGVLLESIYVGSIPVAPEQLLLQNNLPGIGYHDMDAMLDSIRAISFDNQRLNLVREEYSRKNFVEKLNGWF